MTDQRSAASGHRCPTCEQKLDEVVVRITGVCPTHGVVPVVCGDPECWCALWPELAPPALRHLIPKGQGPGDG